jgi:arabinofuranosyltransferase
VLRVSVENQCGIGDERGWYARKAGSAHPVELAAYRSHPFYDSGLTTMQHLHEACPSLDEDRKGACHRMVVDEDKPHIAPAPTVVPLATSVDPRVDAVVSSGAIGIFGYLFPSDVHVVDMHGLAEPYAARFALESRGRPGHEKKLAAGWLLARFAEPSPGEDASVTAARRALRCSTLPALEQAISGPLSGRAFLSNLAHAWSYSRLRIPADPFEAEVSLCGAARAVVRGTGMALAGLRGTLKPKEQALASVQPLCRASTAESLGPLLLDGPVFGEATSDGSFEVSCPSGAVVSGLFGTSDNLVRSVGVTCGQGRAGRHMGTGGYARGHGYALDCARLEALAGLEVRAGTMLDSIGLACLPEGRPRAPAP